MTCKTLNLIDGYGYVFRAYFALPPLTDPKGRPVGAVFGFCRMLLNLLEKHQGEPLAVVLDSGGKNHRHEFYPAYKSHRPPAPEDLVPQFPLIRQACLALGIPVIEMPNQEADDLIATYARRGEKSGFAINIVSSDKDLMQLVNTHVTLFDPMKNKTIDTSGVFEKFGVHPNQVIDVQALMGDSADNVPGVPGIGPKTATQLIVEYGSLDNLYQNVDAMPASKRKENLIQYKQQAFISKELVTLIDVPHDGHVEELVVKLEPDQALAFMKNMGFSALVKKVETLYKTNTHTSVTASSAPSADVDHTYQGCRVYDDLKTTLATQPDLNPFQTHDRASLALSISQGLKNQEDQETFEEMYQKALDQKTIDNYLLCDRFMPFVLSEMEKTGIAVDVPYLQQLKQQYDQHVQDLEKKIYQEAGIEFNINSPKQLGHILYEKNQFPTASKTKTGQFSTDADTLAKIAALGYALPQLILDYRQYAKIISTYLQPLIEKSVNGRVHSTFNHTQTLTGRLSSQNPNLQNIPVKTEDGKAVRRAFCASDGNTLISFDYSQIELRLLAHYADEAVLIEAFKNGEDIHTTTAQHLFDDTSPEFRRIAKTVNFGIVYGISAHGLSENLGISRTQAQKIIDDYFQRYPKVRGYIEQQIHLAKTQGFVTTITHRPIYIHDINSKNPALQQFAQRQSTNVPLQGSNAELIKRAMVKIYFWLKNNNMASKMVLQIHDELIFDVPKDEINVIQQKVQEIMSSICPLKVPIVVNCGLGLTWLEAH